MSIKSTKDMVIQLKDLYEQEGIKACGEVFNLILKQSPTKPTASFVMFLIHLVYKMDTCTNNCWEYLEDKQYLACECNDEPFLVPLESKKLIDTIGES